MCDKQWRDISGDFYDWTVTKKPERPFRHDYSKTLVMKMPISVPDGKGGSKIFNSFDQTLEKIKKTDAMTLGIPKIIYLVGWQYNGHDDKYPAWFEVNHRLKRDCDETAADSLKWLMEEAYQYNTTVSLHINMTDAYRDSPLWDTYTAHDLISKKEDGSFKDIGTWNNKTAYQVFYKNEWEKGFAVKRIDALISMLPLEKAGTVHIDAFFCRPSEGHGVPVIVEQEYRRKIIRYWREKGIDVTGEFIFRENKTDDLIGLMPMAWWFNQSQKSYMNRPAELFCGGQINKDLPGDKKLSILFGQNMHGEDHFAKGDWEKGFIEDFCLKTLPWYYLNCHQRLSINKNLFNSKVFYSHGLTACLDKKVIEQNGVILRIDDNVFIPLLWRKDREIAVFSLKGYSGYEWKLPQSWSDVASVDIYRITPQGLQCMINNRAVSNSRIEISVDQGEALLIKPYSIKKER